MDYPFQKGDFVRLKTGRSRIIVHEVRYFENESAFVTRRYGSFKSGWFIKFSYHSNLQYNHEGKWRKASDFLMFNLCSEQNTIKKEEPIMDILYQTNEEPPRFGVERGTNGDGQLILEMKGDDGYKAFAKADLEEVMPFTVDLEPLMKSDNDQSSMHVVAKKNQVEKDDVLLELGTGRLWRVTIVDSKCRSPKPNKSKWMKVPTEMVIFGDV